MIEYALKLDFPTTNNEVEYKTLIAGLGLARAMRAKNLKVSTKATPFMLDYGAEAVVPLEITHGSPRIEAYEPGTNEEGMRLVLDLIDEVRDEANARNAEHQRRTSIYYNRRVKERFFQQGDLVLRKIEAPRVRERGKLVPNWEGPYKVRKTLERGSNKLETLNGNKVPRTGML
ncbi:uncharacterized protein LOC141665630 [Apium graveolens]|uniref:uncharacterized protein LOC141665630 n=1 Tax=Apium graveolens TaxID=4045 RepID=UPI003D79223A